MGRPEPKMKWGRVPLVASMQTAWRRLYLERERPAGIQFAQRDDLLTVGFRHFFSLDPYFLTRFSMRVDHLDGELGLGAASRHWHP